VSIEEQIQAFEKHRVRPIWEDLAARGERVGERRKAAEERCDKAHEAADAEVDALAAKASPIDPDASDLEWLTGRAAQVDRDLASGKHAVTISEANLDLAKIDLEWAELELQMSHVGLLMEDSAGAVAVGNDDQMAIYRLEVQAAALEHATALAKLDLARRQFTLVKRLHKDVHAALKRAQKTTPGR
jgi:uncharacterized protein (UPF0212 family)